MMRQSVVTWILLYLVCVIIGGLAVSNEVCVSLDTSTNSNQVTGSQSPRGERPWVVLLWVTCPSLPRLTTCEGSVVDREWVLTAKSCLICGENASVVADIGLYLSDIRQEIIQNHPVARIGIDRVLTPLHYKAETRRHDLALLHLNTPVNQSHVIPLADCSKSEHDVSNSFLSSGWGGSRRYSSLDNKPLQDIHLYMWSRDSCSALSPTGDITKSFFCAGVKMYSEVNTSIVLESIRSHDSLSSQEPCYVDHGSSLVTQVSRVVSGANRSVKITCEWQLCGVLSFGLHCGPNSIPGFYTNVCTYRSWLVDTIKQERGMTTSTHSE